MTAGQRALSPRLILDAGAVIALTRGSPSIRSLLRAASGDRAEAIVPPVVVTQTVRGGPRDAPINQLLKTVDVPAVSLALARRAGELLGVSGLADAADAQVAAEALRRPPAVILTGDPHDLQRLTDGHAGIRVLPI